MHMYKNMRDELLREESKTKSDNQKHKIEELNVKMAQMDIAKKDKEDKSRRQEQEEQQRRDANEAKIIIINKMHLFDKDPKKQEKHFYKHVWDIREEKRQTETSYVNQEAEMWAESLQAKASKYLQKQKEEEGEMSEQM